MAAGPPLTRLVLAASSVADDLGYVALADLSAVLGTDEMANHRVIGGRMVTLLAARWQLGPALYRETADTDLGVPPVVVQEHGLISRMKELGYEQVAGNRFARHVPEIPVHVYGAEDSPRKAVVDLLVPAYTSRARTNLRISDEVVTTEVPGLALALQRQPITMVLELHRLNGDMLTAELSFPDEVSALVLKCFATQVRRKATDVADVWRCLEVAFAAGIGPDNFAEGDAADAAEIARALFDRRDGSGMTGLAEEKQLSRSAADQRFTRLRALVARVIGISD